MENFKKYEMYINKIKTGVLNINWNVTKKVMAYSIAGIITATTLTGCSFSNQQTNNKEITDTTYDEKSIDDIIFEKQYFVDSVLEELYNLDNYGLVNKIMGEYQYIKEIEEKLDLTNEYAEFLTEDEIYSKKESMNLHLDKAINIIENNTDFRYGEDFISYIRIK